MFITGITNATQKRTLRPLYAQHQATPYAGFLDPDHPRSKDILPGMVMGRLEGETFALCDKDNENVVPFGLAALFVAPELGVDEVTDTGDNLFTVWTGGPDAVFEVLAPAFDEDAEWATPTGGAQVFLTASEEGKLTPASGSDPIVAELIEVVSENVIVVSLNRTPAQTV